MIQFSVTSADRSSRARCGVLATPRGEIDTPAFMPVGTSGPVRGIAPDELEQCGFGLMLSNAYHLYLRPGHELIGERGGLHRFTGWSGAILTDSGGFQIVSLGAFCQVNESGVQFKSHLDGSLHQFTPELSIDIQKTLGADIMMALDDCPQFPCASERVLETVQRTTRWASRCLEAAQGTDQALFGIVQGGVEADLRRQAAQEIVALGFDGYALGGLSLGEEKDALFAMVDATVLELPMTRPRYLMGVGMPEDLVEGVWRGIDLFDCVLPSRHGRTGWLFTSEGRVLIKNAQYARDDSPIDPRCACPVCRRFSRAYLRHLFVSNEMLGPKLNTVHNLWYYANLMADIRRAIQENRLQEFREDFYRLRKDASQDTRTSEEGEAGSGAEKAASYSKERVTCP